MDENLKQMIAKEIEKEKSQAILRHQADRKALWCDTIIAVASSDNCDRVEIAISWADDILAAFDETFPA